MEYHSIVVIASKLQWVNHLLHELGVQFSSTPIIYCDNIGATYLCVNPVFHSWMKHLTVNFYFICNFVKDGVSRVTHVFSYDQLIDGLTKPLTSPCLNDLYPQDRPCFGDRLVNFFFFFNDF